MSTSSAQSTITRLLKKKADLEKAKGQESAKLARLSKEIASLEASTSRSSSQSTRNSKQRDIARKRSSLAVAQKRLAKHESDLAQVAADLRRARQSLASAEASEQAKQDAAEKKRRSEELKHSRTITGDLRRQADLYKDTSAISFAQPHELLYATYPAPEETDPLQKQAQDGIASRAAWLATRAAGAAGATTMAVLAVSSVLPLMPGLSAATVMPWLTALGMNTLAAWLGSWAERAVTEAFDEEEDALLEYIAVALQQALRTNELLADDVSSLLTYTEATTISIRALAGDSLLQRGLIERVLVEVQSGELVRGKLHAQVMTELSQHSVLLSAIYERQSAMLALLQSMQPGKAPSSGNAPATCEEDTSA